MTNLRYREGRGASATKKKRLLCFLLASISLLFAACHDNNGYAGKVTLPAKGGTKVIKGDHFMHTYYIANFNGRNDGAQDNSDEDSIRVSYQWLKASSSFRERGKEIVVTAEPNTTGKRRRLYIHGMVMNDVITIKVVQTER